MGQNDSNDVCSSCERKTNKTFVQRMAFISFDYCEVMINFKLSEGQQLSIAVMAVSV